MAEPQGSAFVASAAVMFIVLMGARGFVALAENDLHDCLPILK